LERPGRKQWDVGIRFDADQRAERSQHTMTFLGSREVPPHLPLAKSLWREGPVRPNRQRENRF
jgi:hypothetical protein